MIKQYLQELGQFDEAGRVCVGSAMSSVILRGTFQKDDYLI